MASNDGLWRAPEDEAARAAERVSARMLSESDSVALNALEAERDRLVALAALPKGRDLVAELDALKSENNALRAALVKKGAVSEAEIEVEKES